MKILLVGLSTRALAESAVRAGSDVITVDYFGDLDQKRLCENVSLRERGLKYGAASILTTARGLAYDAVAYAGGLENAPDVVAALAEGRTLLGNEPTTLRRVRDPAVVFPFLASRGWEVPRVVRPGEAPPRIARHDKSRLGATRREKPGSRAGLWVQKPIRGGGGQGVRFWRGRPLLSGQMLQEYIDGVPASAAFIADGYRSILLGWTEQLRGPRGFLYGGNLLPLEGPPAAADEVRAIADGLTVEFGLRGLNGLDFVLRAGHAVPLEVNPRYSASMELIERASGVSVFGLHVSACAGALPSDARPAASGQDMTGPVEMRSKIQPPAQAGAIPPPDDSRVWGKAIAYAQRTMSVGDTADWIGRGIRDVPHSGEVIRQGHPICTVFASAATHAECRARLRDEVASIVA